MPSARRGATIAARGEAAHGDGRGGGGAGKGDVVAARAALERAAAGACCWCSGAIFGAYIIAFFGGAALRGETARWNESLANLHDPATPLATLAMGVHFATGGVLLLLGPLQLIGALRRRHPALHRWLGRLYVLCACVAGLGGLGFILSRGTIGGAVMSTGFALYGALMAVAATLTYAAARAGRTEAHRAWAIRLFALTVGSWLYRMEYGAWFLAIGRDGHTADFRGGFDQALVFLFYLPNLAVAELFVRVRRRTTRAATTLGATAVLLAATAFVAAATWFFTLRSWGPGIAAGLLG
ncbi:DUF2306 domain-containing protein [Sphingomonas sp. BK069]|uniref:DUF2306 domain-containing protein n=1 Tax=Sphingomonas sp. BK069 TaxID=2586979 RepID=UPI0017FAB404|nr:DUF2306 domain-containing protein [Sphingomonas sp. BK069]MBB3347412.1 hypothetical protein [Sphingomonas sp. BK069]